MSRVTARRPTRRITPAGVITRPDTLAVEEPLEIRIDGSALTVTMRTPGHDIDLVHGFLFSENIIESADDIVSARYCAGAEDRGVLSEVPASNPDTPGEPEGGSPRNHEGLSEVSESNTARNTYNVLDVELRHPVAVRPRGFVTNSSCGVCGTTALDQVRTRSRFPLPAGSPRIDAAVLAALPDELRTRQAVFDATGGLHAAGLFTSDGRVLVVREDIGRHNAVDKVVGWALREQCVPAHDTVLIVSGRTSFELVQKAVMAGIPILGAVSAPSSLAVDLAVDNGLTLAGFLRGGTMNIYSGAERLSLEGAATGT